MVTTADVKWIRRGSQRRAVAQVLRKPMCTKELWETARRINPCVQIRDLWLILGQMKQQRLVVCPNPGAGTGKIHCLTARGRKAVAQAFGIVSRPLPRDVDWDLYGQVVRGRLRKDMVVEAGRQKYSVMGGATASALRKGLRDTHPVGISEAVRCLRWLADMGLVACVGVTRKRQQKLYQLTDVGRRVVDVLLLHSAGQAGDTRESSAAGRNWGEGCN